MWRAIPLIVAGLICPFDGLAQQAEPVRPGPRRAAPAETGPQGEQKLRWICKQLHLDETQSQTAEALIQIYKAEVEEQKKDPSALLQRIQDKYAELRKAQADGDTDLAKQLQAELKEMAPGVQAENRFFGDLEASLTPQQKEQLSVIRKKAETIGDISMRPIHILRAARKRGLSLEQEKQLEAILDEFRKNMVANRPDSAEANTERVNKLTQDIRALLTPPQAEAFDQEVRELHDGAPPATPITPATAAPPATLPAAPPAEPQK